MTLKEMLEVIHKKLKEACFVDLKDETGVSANTLWVWRDEPPENPSLKVFCRLAHWAGLNPTIDQLEELF